MGANELMGLVNGFEVQPAFGRHNHMIINLLTGPISSSEHKVPGG